MPRWLSAAETTAEPLTIRGDRSHLQQILENLVFNGRDATFEMRNLYRDRARTESDGEQRKQRLLAAAGWKGHVVVKAFAEGTGCVVLHIGIRAAGRTTTACAHEGAN